MRNDEHKKGRRDIHLAKFKPNQLLQGTVHNLHKFGDYKTTQKGNGKTKNSYRSQMSSLDTKGLVETIKMVDPVRGHSI